MARFTPLGEKREKTLSFKVTGEMDRRLKSAAKFTGLTPSALALTAVDAVLAAIERDDGIVMPPRVVITHVGVDVARIPVEAYPKHKHAAPTASQVIAAAKNRQAARGAKRAESQAETHP